MNNQEQEWLLKEKYRGEKTTAFERDCGRLAAGEPLAYIIGYIPFLNSKIWLDSKPLIPRAETEYWVAKLKQELLKLNNTATSILDLCAGSGCIGVALGQNLPTLKIDFVEIETEHLMTITKNCQENGITKGQFRLFQGDLFYAIEKEDSYDYIVSNPPYIDKILDRTAKSVRDNEPDLALYGGAHGMEIITKIIQAAPKYLKKHGELWIEHEPEQTNSITKLAKNTFNVITYVDQYKVERFSKLMLQ